MQNSLLVSLPGILYFFHSDVMDKWLVAQTVIFVNRVEEYFEEDHQVLNKPLHSNIIDIKFPKLKKPKDYSYWLSRSTQQEEKQDSSYGPYRKVIFVKLQLYDLIVN